MYSLAVFCVLQLLLSSNFALSVVIFLFLFIPLVWFFSSRALRSQTMVQMLTQVKYHSFFIGKHILL